MRSTAVVSLGLGAAFAAGFALARASAPAPASTRVAPAAGVVCAPASRGRERGAPPPVSPEELRRAIRAELAAQAPSPVAEAAVPEPPSPAQLLALDRARAVLDRGAATTPAGARRW